MRRWQRVGVAGALALAALLLRPRRAGESELVPGMPMPRPNQDHAAKDADESTDRATHAE